MNARPQCLDSFAADAHVQRLSDDDAASDFWAVQADREIRAGLRLKKPADWFETRISGPRGGWSPDELLLHALDCDNEPVRGVFSRVMVGQASAAELHTVLVDFALEHCSEGVAAALEQEARNAG
ncbi:hypothetical protein [Delftia tsuruhatensis]|uniref:hypothetical protein n=1 Tax=Delftia tsuruhatensis TaxID=180282 RepID=UPI002091C0D3|nr:hypothetical protein [Delftia tsuruhatensis]MCO5338579.1 hypothetical protein [Delftia tsuruhatensis]MCR4546637.1 hypothetical protein [Delftia tsuruhatensis]